MKIVAGLHIGFLAFWVICVAAGTLLSERLLFDVNMEGRDVTPIESLNLLPGGAEMIREALYFFSASFGFLMAVPLLLGIIVLLFPHRAGIAMLIGVAILHLCTGGFLILLPTIYVMFLSDTQEVYSAASWRPQVGFWAGLFGLLFATFGLFLWFRIQAARIVTTDSERCIAIAQEMVPGVEETDFEPVFSFHLPGLESVFLSDEQSNVLFFFEVPMEVVSSIGWTKLEGEADVKFPWGDRQIGTNRRWDEDGYVFTAPLKKDESCLVLVLRGQSEDPEAYKASLEELKPEGEALLEKL